MKFINIHTHKHLQNNNINLINLFPNDSDNIYKGGIYSIGIHPWEVTKANIKDELQVVEKQIISGNIVAVGEIGLDKYKDNFELQKEVFLKQIDIANTLAKPIIVHCVKAYSEFLNILKDGKINVPIIIHRYSGNKTIAKELIKFGCYLSFGHELFNTKSKVHKVYKSIPIKNIFLETDDAEICIEDVYKKASEIKEIEIVELQKLIFANYCRVFNIDL